MTPLRKGLVALGLLVWALDVAAQPVAPAYRQSLVLTYAFYAADGRQTGVYEQAQWTAEGPSLTIRRLYRNGAGPFTATCPNVEDRFQWEGSRLYYRSTRNSYEGTLTTFEAPGHWWLGTDEVLGYARWNATEHGPAVHAGVVSRRAWARRKPDLGCLVAHHARRDDHDTSHRTRVGCPAGPDDAVWGAMR